MRMKIVSNLLNDAGKHIRHEDVATGFPISPQLDFIIETDKPIECMADPDDDIFCNVNPKEFLKASYIFDGEQWVAVMSLCGVWEKTWCEHSDQGIDIGNINVLLCHDVHEWMKKAFGELLKFFTFKEETFVAMTDAIDVFRCQFRQWSDGLEEYNAFVEQRKKAALKWDGVEYKPGKVPAKTL